MPTGRIISTDHAPGVGTIQPDDGSETKIFASAELREAVTPNTPVSFDTARKGNTGVQVVNVRVVKAADE